MPFCVIKSRTIKIFCAIVVVMVLLCIPFTGGNCAQVFFGYSGRRVPVYSVATEEKKVAISFDAAWGADKTEGILSILKEYEANATFFLVGFWVDKFPEMVKKIDEAGVEIGTHSNTHPDMVKLDKATMKNELSTSIDKIKNITGKEVSVFRPPYGSYNNTLLDTCDELKLTTIQWDVDSLDWKGLSGGEICSRVISKIKNGSIILMHNNADHVLDALPLVLSRLKMQGYKVTSVGDLIYKDNYTIDNNGTQKPN